MSDDGLSRALIGADAGGPRSGATAAAPPLSLDTLAQPRKIESPDTSELARLQRRARAKYASFALATALAEWAKQNGSDLEQSYRNAIYCVAWYQSVDGQLSPRVTPDHRGGLCKTRWCLYCSRIRTGIAVNKYGPILADGSDWWFVTLTRPNVLGADLADEIGEIAAVERRVRDRLRKSGTKVHGIRKLECTFNATRGDFHPHFHYVVRGRVAADALVAGWLKSCPDASPRAQDVRPASDPVELFKYFTKLTTRHREPGRREWCSLAALDTIFGAMRGRRVWQPLGDVLAATRGGPDEESDLDEGYTACPHGYAATVWEWDQRLADWIDVATGECLTGYTPRRQMRALVEGSE